MACYNCNMHRPPNASGFTLLELIVVIGIAAILLSAGIPQFLSMGLNASRAQGGTSLLSAFNQARSEAIARNATVTVCRRAFFATSAYPTCALDSGSWTQGWIVYRDSDNGIDGSEPDNASDVISVFDPVGKVSATSETDAFKIVPTSNPAYLQYASNGRPSQSISFTLCDRSHRLSDSRRVEIAPSGYVSLRALDAATTTSTCG